MFSFRRQMWFWIFLAGKHVKRFESLNSPTENTKNQVHDEKRSQNNHRDEINPLPTVSHRILDVWSEQQVNDFNLISLKGRFLTIKHVGPALERDALEHRQHGQAEVVEIRDAKVWPFPEQTACHRWSRFFVEGRTLEAFFTARMLVVHHLFGSVLETSFVKFPRKQLQSNYCVDNDYENNEKCDVESLGELGINF